MIEQDAFAFQVEPPLPVLAHAEDTETDDVALRVHPFHDGVVGGFLLVSGRVREADFEKVRLGVEPYFYFVGHRSSPSLGLSIQ